MNSIRYLKRMFSRTPARAATPPTDTSSLAGAPSPTGPTTPSAGTSGATDELDGAGVHYPELPELPPDISGPAYQPASSADDPSSAAPVLRKQGDTPTAQTNTAERPKLSAKPQAGRTHGRAADHNVQDLAGHIVIEKFDSPGDSKPQGYLGTVAGARICASTEEDYCPCGTGGGHWLVCGHAIVSNTNDTTCGANCKTGLHAAEPFNCPLCRDIVTDIVENKFTPEEKSNTEFRMSISIISGVALYVEYVTKHVPTVKGNISQTVMSILEPQHGRACQIVPDTVRESKNLADMYQEHSGAIKKNARARRVEIEIGPLNTQDKRKASADEEAPASTPETSESPAVTAVADKANKKQKQKLETHSEPITDSTRGVKRTVAENNWSDDETLVDEDSPRPANKDSKKQKQKLETQREPITAETRGEKRGLGDELTPDTGAESLGLLKLFYDVTGARANKRFASFRLADLGDAPFLPLPAGLYKGPRKHVLAEDDNPYSNKRQCHRDVRPSEMEDTVALFAAAEPKKRMSMDEFLAMNADDDEL